MYGRYISARSVCSDSNPEDVSNILPASPLTTRLAISKISGSRRWESQKVVESGLVTSLSEAIQKVGRRTVCENRYPMCAVDHENGTDENGDAGANVHC